MNKRDGPGSTGARQLSNGFGIDGHGNGLVTFRLVHGGVGGGIYDRIAAFKPANNIGGASGIGEVRLRPAKDLDAEIFICPAQQFTGHLPRFSKLQYRHWFEVSHNRTAYQISAKRGKAISLGDNCAPAKSGQAMPKAGSFHKMPASLAGA